MTHTFWTDLVASGMLVGMPVARLVGRPLGRLMLSSQITGQLTELAYTSLLHAAMAGNMEKLVRAVGVVQGLEATNHRFESNPDDEAFMVADSWFTARLVVAGRDRPVVAQIKSWITISDPAEIHPEQAFPDGKYTDLDLEWGKSDGKWVEDLRDDLRDELRSARFADPAARQGAEQQHIWTDFALDVMQTIPPQTIKVKTFQIFEVDEALLDDETGLPRSRLGELREGQEGVRRLLDLSSQFQGVQKSSLGSLDELIKSPGADQLRMMIGDQLMQLVPKYIAAKQAEVAKLEERLATLQQERDGTDRQASPSRRRQQASTEAANKRRQPGGKKGGKKARSRASAHRRQGPRVIDVEFEERPQDK